MLQLRDFQRFDGPTHKISQLMKRWDDRLTLQGPVLVDAYLNRRMAILLVVEIGWGARSDRFLLAFTVSDKEPIAGAERGHVIFIKDQLKHMGAPGGWQRESPVFIFSVEMIEGMEPAFPSVTVGFDIFRDYMGDMRRMSLYQSKLTGFYERVPRIVHREIHTGYVTFATPDDFGGDVVECRSEIMHNIPQHWSDILIDVELRPLNLNNNVSSFGDVWGAGRISLSPTSLQVSLQKGSAPVFNLLDMLVGPFDL